MMTIEKNKPLAQYTTFNIGGPAKYFVCAREESDIQEALAWSRENNMSVFLIGGGSNILISDQGYDGLVIFLEDVDPKVDPEALQITCFSGCKLTKLLETAAENGFAGMENMAGIPGTVGGAVRGNAGAFGTETKDTVLRVRALNRETGEMHEFEGDQCEFSYRMSMFKKDPHWIVVGADFGFKKGDTGELVSIMEDIKHKRNEKHDQSAKCAGSFFVNPVVEDDKLRKEFEQEAGVESRGNKVPAGWLIDKVDLRGRKIGGAMVSNEHPNYIVNTGDATADDVIMLVSIVKQVVRDTYNIELLQEVQYVGFE